MGYNINDELEKDQKEHGKAGSSNNFFQIKEGSDNVFRVLTAGAVYAQYYMGKGAKPAYTTAYGKAKGDPREENDDLSKSIYYVLYVIDRADGLVKQADLPFSVMKSIGDLQKNPDFTFDDFPMPYDIRVTYDKAAAPAAKYKVAGVPKMTPVTAAETEELDEKMRSMTPQDVVEKKKERQMDADKDAGVWITPEQLQAEAEDFAKKNPGLSKKVSGQDKDIDLEDSGPEINPDDIPF